MHAISCGLSPRTSAPRQKRARQTRVRAFRPPGSFNDLLKQAQVGTQRALEDGANLLEIEFPPAGLCAVPGDGEGANEMSWNMGYLRTFLTMFNREADKTRVFFPDKSEMLVAKRGKGIDPNAGSWVIEAQFQDTRFQLDFLTNPTGLLDIGLDLKKVDVKTKVLNSSDARFVCAYPSFQVQELEAVAEVYQAANGRPVIVFNGELDRFRTGYYPSLFYPKIAQLSKTFIPAFKQAYYLRNLKGSRAGCIFHVYGEPWQVYARRSFDPTDVVLVWEGDAMPTLKDVQLKILPNARSIEGRAV